MADAIVSILLEQLISVAAEEVKQEVRLVVGVDKEVKKLTNNLQAIEAVLIDAEQRQVKETRVKLWLDQLKHASYDMEDALDEWRTAMMKLQMEGAAANAVIPKKKVCSYLFASPCFCFRQVGLRRDIAVKIKDINENLDDIAKLKDMFNFSVNKGSEEHQRVKSVSFVDVNEIHGRAEEKNALVSKLLCENSVQQQGLRIISIVGMGGIGKTTVAQLAYNDSEVMKNFEKRIWVCVSDPFDEGRIAKAIIEGLDSSASNLGELESLLQQINRYIIGKKFLLVLDDVWTEDNTKWEPFYHCLKNGLHGSKILVTTRKETVARMMESIDIISMKELSKEECWLLFKRFAFFDRSSKECEKLEDIGRKIVGKCKGLPLAAKTIGGLLRFKKTREEWQNILDSEIWELEKFEKDILPPLLLSYNDLPSMVRRCFSYCAIFPKDYNINKDQLIKLWMAQGYLGLEQNKELEITGQECFDNLATRSFFQDFEKDGEEKIISCKMHDIVHDFAQFLSKDECFTVRVDYLKEPSINPSHLEKVRHLMLIINTQASFPVSIGCVKKLRSLVIENQNDDYSSICNALQMLFDELTCLRALHIGGSFIGSRKIKEIRKERAKMVHLRYLKFSWLNVEELHEACCELYNLQTLEFQYCSDMKRLPQGIGKLVNLRHLIFDHELSYMPKGIERLTCLRKISYLEVRGSGQCGGRAFTLGCLKNLNHLRGSLDLKGLSNAVAVEEAKMAELENKKNIFHLNLFFDIEEATAEGMNEDDEVVLQAVNEAVLEALQPPPDLEKLGIFYCRANNLFPSWIMSLTRLTNLTLSWGVNCEHMPPLGTLRFLEILHIEKMTSVKRIGEEFLGISSAASSFAVFPSLKCLSFLAMDEWEEWDLGITQGENDIAIMPCLCSLIILICQKLKALPDHLLQRTELQKLKISECPVLEDRYKHDTGEDWPKISHIPRIEFYW